MSVSGPAGMFLGEGARAQEIRPCNFNLFYEENITRQGEESLGVNQMASQIPSLRTWMQACVLPKPQASHSALST